MALAAWRDIYGYGNTRKFPKYNYPKTNDGTNSLLTADEDKHSRQRKSANRAFSDKALKAQEPTFQKHLDVLMNHCSRAAAGLSGNVIDMVKWFNYASFDLISDLTFGEGFGCLEEDEFHPSVAAILEFNRSTTFMEEALKFPLLFNVLMALIPKKRPSMTE